MFAVVSLPSSPIYRALVVNVGDIAVHQAFCNTQSLYTNAFQEDDWYTTCNVTAVHNVYGIVTKEYVGFEVIRNVPVDIQIAKSSTLPNIQE